MTEYCVKHFVHHFHSISPGGLAGDKNDVQPASGFPLRAEQIWKTIKENKNLDLPAMETGPEPKFRKKLITYDNVDCESADDSAHNLSNDNVDCESADDLADDTVDDCDNE
uniref:Uncharacterized protein n=1 Tax=Populus alba TaxID=43335 RepID=A0A4U5MXZ9_POPAL|nr:hypothetical protein D5086_0000289880 [Populus alba]